jgi:hypothetical protein
MTISSTSSRVVYSGDGTKSSFDFAFYVSDQADLVVTYTDSAGNPTVISPGPAPAGYQISAPAIPAPGWPAGGTVTYNPGSPIAIGTTFTIQRVVAGTQPTTLSNQGALWPQVIERALDRIVTIVQGFVDQTARSLQIPPTDGTALNKLPTAGQRANSVLAFDGSGQPYAATLVSSLAGVATWLFNNFLQQATSAAAACTALGAFFLSGSNTASGNNTFSGTNDFTSGRLKAPTRAAGDSGTDSATTAFVQTAIATATAAALGNGVRQTVICGPVDNSGLPTFWPASVAGLTLTTQNLSSTYPLVASAANGFSTDGRPVNVPGYSTSNLSWTATNGSTVYAYATIGTNGVMTPNTTALVPIYQWGGVPSTTSGQFTFNIVEMRGYMGNGTTAPQANIVFFGEITASGGNVTGTVMYAYNGRYESAWMTPLPASATATSANHNIGANPRVVDWVIENMVSDLGYLVGDQIHQSALYTNPSAIIGVPVLSASRLSMSVIGITSNVATWLTLNKSSAAQTNLSVANWRHKFVASRGW